MENKAATDLRKNNFKNKDAFGSDQVRERRQKHTVEIRKQKREENLSKRRNMNLPSASMSDSEDDIEVEDDVNVRLFKYRRRERGLTCSTFTNFSFYSLRSYMLL